MKLKENVLGLCKNKELEFKDIDLQLKDVYYSWNSIEKYSRRMM